MFNFSTMFCCIIGTILEWYDFAIFGVLSPLLSQIFFPHQSKQDTLVIAFMIFFTGFIMRPIGGVFLGHIGDKYGRKKSIVISVLLMTIATIGIGLLPVNSDYSTAVIILLIFCRLLQGFSVGGETSGMIAFMSEFWTKRRFLFGQSFVYAGVTAGMLLGTVIGKLSLSSYTHGVTIAWRIPFIIGVITGILGLYFRLKVSETVLFEKLVKARKTVAFPLFTLLVKHYKELAYSLLVMMSGSCVFYFTLIYYPLAYVGSLTSHGYYLYSQGLGLMIILILTPFFSYFYQECHAKKIAITGLITLAVLATPLLMVTAKYPHYMLWVTQIIFAVNYASFQVLVPTIASLCFPHQVRCTGVSLSLNATVVLGAASPVVIMELIKLTGLDFAAGFYIGLTSLAGAIIILLFSRKIDGITVLSTHLIDKTS